MIRIVVEKDGILNLAPVILDPATPAEHRSALASFYGFDVPPDVPDFDSWCARVRAQIPGLFPAKVIFAADEAQLRAQLGEADAVIVESLPIGEAELALAPRLAIVQKFGMLAANVDVAACARHGVTVEIQRRRVNIAVAEQAFALMIALAKRLCALNGVVEEKTLRAAGFDPSPYDRRYTGNSNFARIKGLRTLHGSVLGLIGMGEIGREVASRGHAFGMKVLYHQRNRINPLDEWALGASYVGLAELMAQSDFISIQLPLNDATRGFLGRDALQRMRQGTILVNAARGELIDRAALIEALDSGILAGFGLDVGYTEPARPDDPLLKYRDGNVILMPHTAPAERANGLKDMEEMCLKIWRALKTRLI
jgi:phosphoglycerate dehydrogenase-like enzyme